MEYLLRKEEITLIERYVASNPILKDKNCIGDIFGQQRTSVLKVSPIKGIIFIKGDKNTGFNHIIHRHNFGQNQFYNSDTKRQNQSQFSNSSIPIINFYEKNSCLINY